MTYHHQVCNYINTTGTTSWAGTAYPSGTHEFILVCGVVRVTRSLVLWSFFFWPLCCLSFDLLILITSLWYHQTLLILVALVLDLVILFFNNYFCILLLSWCPILTFFKTCVFCILSLESSTHRIIRNMCTRSPNYLSMLCSDWPLLYLRVQTHIDKCVARKVRITSVNHADWITNGSSLGKLCSL